MEREMYESEQLVDREGDCEGVFIDRKPKISFDRRKEIVKLVIGTAESIVGMNVKPHELRFFLSNLSKLLEYQP